MTKAARFALAIKLLPRVITLILAALVAPGMAQHLISGLYPHLTGAIVAYLASSLLALGSMAWPSRLNATRWYLCGPFFALTTLGIVFSHCSNCWTGLFKIHEWLGTDPYS